MIDFIDPIAWIAALNGLRPEVIWVFMLLFCFFSILIAVRFMGQAGLYAYITLAIIGANLQVLKPVQFTVWPEPVALGTVLFASSYLCTDILAELYGRDAARRGVWVGFSAFLFWTILALLTLGFDPLTEAQAGEGLAWAVPNHDAMAALFVPTPIFFIAGMAAYLVSQFHDIWLYRLIKRWTVGRHLWLRNNLSTIFSAAIDTVVFNVLAWIVLAPEPMELRTVVVTFMLFTFFMRVGIALIDTPFLYAARAIVASRANPIAGA